MNTTVLICLHIIVILYSYFLTRYHHNHGHLVGQGIAFSALTLLVGRQEGHPACKTLEWWGAGMVTCLELGADLHMAQLMSLPLTVSCFSKIQIGFTFLVPAHPGSPGKRAVKRVCVSWARSVISAPLCPGLTAHLQRSPMGRLDLYLELVELPLLWTTRPMMPLSYWMVYVSDFFVAYMLCHC